MTWRAEDIRRFRTQYEQAVRNSCSEELQYLIENGWEMRRYGEEILAEKTFKSHLKSVRTTCSVVLAVDMQLNSEEST